MRPLSDRCMDGKLTCRGRIHLPMKPTFSCSAAMDRHRAVVVLLVPACFQRPPDDTKAPTRPIPKAVAAMAAREVDRSSMLFSVWTGLPPRVRRDHRREGFNSFQRRLFFYRPFGVSLHPRADRR